MTGSELSFRRVSVVRAGWQGGPQAARTSSMHYIIDSAYIDGTMARRLMQAAASADQPGAHGMSGVEGASPRDREWVLVQVCIHEASHATVAERYGHPAAVRIERGAGFGSGLCMVRGPPTSRIRFAGRSVSPGPLAISSASTDRRSRCRSQSTPFGGAR